MGKKCRPEEANVGCRGNCFSTHHFYGSRKCSQELSGSILHFNRAEFWTSSKQLKLQWFKKENTSEVKDEEGAEPIRCRWRTGERRNHRVSPIHLPDVQFGYLWKVLNSVSTRQRNSALLYQPGWSSCWAADDSWSCKSTKADMKTWNTHKHIFRVVNPSLAFIFMLIDSCTSFLQWYSFQLLRDFVFN